MDLTYSEEDESFRQIIPYVVLRSPGRIFSYARTARAGERRLHGLRSVGVGGHVNPEDLPDGLPGLVAAPEPALVAAAGRELAEETVLPAGAELRTRTFPADAAPARPAAERPDPARPDGPALGLPGWVTSVEMSQFQQAEHSPIDELA